MSILSSFYPTQAATIIKNLEKRHMKGTYCATKEEARAHILSLIPDASSVGFGGSMSLAEAGIIDGLYEKGTYNVLDRAKCAPADVPNLCRQMFSADYFLMSSNALTLDGELVNIDGSGNRVAALIYGPAHVIVLVGMNKIVANTEDALRRIRTQACPPNAFRLNCKTPCAQTGVCHNCLSPDCICAHTVITRNSRTPDRIHVILVGESLGF